MIICLTFILVTASCLKITFTSTFLTEVLDLCILTFTILCVYLLLCLYGTLLIDS